MIARTRSSQQPPAGVDDLLKALALARLLPQRSLLDWAQRWSSTAGPAECVADLVEAGLLTSWQAGRVLAGQARSLTLGPYRLLERLGLGQAPVYRAEHVLLRRQVVVKVVGRMPRTQRPAASEKRRTDQPARPASRKTGRRWREVEATGMFDHPHIVRALDARTIRGRILLVLEHLDGPDLQQVLDREGALPVERACAVVEQTCLALAAMHERGLVHRDVKPANLIEVARDPLQIKLIDLGLACRHEGSRESDELCGTLDYLAPERANGDGGLDPRSDLYSLGCTFYQLLTGQVPFPGGSGASKLVRHRLDVPIPVCVVRPEVPEAIGRLVLALMAREPEERPATARDALAALQRARSSRAALPATGEWLPDQAWDRMPILSAAPTGLESCATKGLRSWVGPLLLSVLLGTLAGVVARRTLADANAEGPAKGPSAAYSSEKLSAPPRIRIEGSPESYSNLAEAVAAAKDGAVLTLPGRGLLSTPPLDLRGKALTIRAESGEETGLIRASQPGQTWEPLLLADRSLRLVGLTLQDADLDASANPVPLVSQLGDELRLQGCILRGRGSAPLVLARRTARVEVQGGRFEGEGIGLSVEVGREGGQTVAVERTTFQLSRGVALSLWAAEDAPTGSLDLLLQDAAVDANRVLSCRNLPGRLTLRLAGNDLHFRECLASFLGYPDGTAWQARTRWHLQGNRCHPVDPWVNTETQRFPLGR
jgi:serine/threonine protein kinase